MKALRHIELVFFCLVSCTEGDPEAFPAGERPGGRVTVDFGLETPSVKGYFSGEEDAVHSLDLLVFRSSDGGLDARAHNEASNSITADVTEGEKMDWFIVANAPDGVLTYFRNEQEFLSSFCTLGQGMTMFSSGSRTFSEESHSVSALLNRYACKVSMESIRVDWPGALPCLLEKVALLNAVGSCPWSGVPDSGGIWYNCSAVDTDGYIRQMLVWEDGADIDTDEDAPVGAELYAMPNPSTGKDYGLPWTPRCTRLAIELKSGGVSNWYSVDLPAMNCNCHYLVRNVVIKGPGTPEPDQELVRNGIACEISVLPWGTEETDVEFAS